LQDHHLKLNPDTLDAHLRQQLAPVYLVSGDETLLVGEAADAIRASARARGFDERETHFIERAGDWNDVRASAGNLSLFAQRRVVELRLSSGKPGVAGGAALTALIEAQDPDRLLLILAPRLDRDAQGAAWVRAVDSGGAWVQVWPVDVDRLVSWLRGRCARLKLSLPDAALEIIAERTEGNLLAANQELEKLRLMVRDEKVTAEEVLASVADSARFDVFQLGEAALAGDAARALRMLEGLRGEGVEPTLALWALNKAARDIWSASSPLSESRPRVWGRQAAALDRAVRRAPQLRFGRLAVRASRAERMIKGRLGGSPWDELALLAAELGGRTALPLMQRSNSL
jgi:DNA polymerase-3 subunit delta